MYLSYILIVLIAALVSFAGSSFAASGLKIWYKGLKKPDFTPKDNTSEKAWIAVLVLTGISLIVISRERLQIDSTIYLLIMGTAVLNAVLNIFWNYLFFTMHELGLAAIEAFALTLTVLAMTIYMFPISILATLFIIPYLGWCAFTAYLNYKIWELND